MQCFEIQVENSAWEDLIRLYDPLVRGRVHRLLRDANIRPEPEAVDERAYSLTRCAGIDDDRSERDGSGSTHR